MPSSSAHSSSEGEEVIDLALSPGAPEEGLVLTDGEDDREFEPLRSFPSEVKK